MRLKRNDIVIIHPEWSSADPYADEDSMEISNVEDMRVTDLSHVLSAILDKLSPASVKQLLNEKGYFTQEQVKEIKGIKFSDKDQYLKYDLYTGYMKFHLKEFLEKPLSAPIHISDVYAKIDMPKEMQDKIDASIAEREKAKQLKDEKKQKAKIERARKILEAAKIKV